MCCRGHHRIPSIGSSFPEKQTKSATETSASQRYDVRTYKTHSSWNPYRCRNWKETAGVIRFNFMRPDTRNRPAARCDACRYFMVRPEPCLPIQNDGGVIASGIGEANIKKHF